MIHGVVVSPPIKESERTIVLESMEDFHMLLRTKPMRVYRADYIKLKSGTVLKDRRR